MKFVIGAKQVLNSQRDDVIKITPLIHCHVAHFQKTETSLGYTVAFILNIIGIPRRDIHYKFMSRQLRYSLRDQRFFEITHLTEPKKKKK